MLPPICTSQGLTAENKQVLTHSTGFLHVLVSHSTLTAQNSATMKHAVKQADQLGIQKLAGDEVLSSVEDPDVLSVPVLMYPSPFSMLPCNLSSFESTWHTDRADCLLVLTSMPAAIVVVTHLSQHVKCAQHNSLNLLLNQPKKGKEDIH